MEKFLQNAKKVKKPEQQKTLIASYNGGIIMTYDFPRGTSEKEISRCAMLVDTVMISLMAQHLGATEMGLKENGDETDADFEFQIICSTSTDFYEKDEKICELGYAIKEGDDYRGFYDEEIAKNLKSLMNDEEFKIE